MLNVKYVNIATTEIAQILLIYKYIDSELRRNLSRSRENFIIIEILEKLQYQKDIWFDIYINSQKSQEFRSLITSQQSKSQD